MRAIASRARMVAEPMWGSRTQWGPEQLVRYVGLVLVDIEAGARDRSILQRVGKLGSLHKGPASGVDQHRAGLHRGELPTADHAGRLGGRRHVQADHVGAAKQLLEFDQTALRPGSAPALRCGWCRRSRRPVRSPARRSDARFDPCRRCRRLRRSAPYRDSRPGPALPIGPLVGRPRPHSCGRAAARVRLSASSAVASVSTSGVLVTITPRRRHSASSTLSIPTAKFATTRSWGPAASSSCSPTSTVGSATIASAPAPARTDAQA